MTSSALPLPGDGAARPSARAAAHGLRVLPGEAALEVAAPTDAELLARARAGDRGAFGALVGRHHRMLAGLVRQRAGAAAPVEDLLQDVFAKALDKLDGFDGRAAFATWAGAIALNLATDWTRKRSRRSRLAPTSSLGDEEPAHTGGAAPGRALELREEAARARQALDALPLAQRVAVTLRIVEELPYEVVAERVGAPVTTVRTWVSRGLRQVREMLEVTRDER